MYVCKYIICINVIMYTSLSVFISISIAIGNLFVCIGNNNQRSVSLEPRIIFEFDNEF